MDTSYKELLATREDGMIRLFMVNRALQARNEMAEVFQNGSYIPIEAGGRSKEHIIASARNHGDNRTITIAQRHLTALSKDAITKQVIEGRETLICEALDDFPVALPLSEEGE